MLNVSHPLVKYLAENQESEHAAVICQQLYDLAMLSHKQLSPDEMTKFVQRSNEILSFLQNKAKNLKTNIKRIPNIFLLCGKKIGEFFFIFLLTEKTIKFLYAEIVWRTYDFVVIT